jgi:hypothetical protein
MPKSLLRVQLLNEYWNGLVCVQVLILVPMRHMAHRVVKRLAVLAPGVQRKDGVSNLERFQKEFGAGSDDEEEEGMSRKEQKAMDKEKKARAAKSADFKALFEAGNTDDHFRLGLKVGSHIGLKVGPELVSFSPDGIPLVK